MTGYARTLTRMKDDDQRPASPAERVRASEARKVQAGGRRMPGGVLPADAAAALDRLQAGGYATSATGCIARALVDADEALPDIDRRTRTG